MTVYGCFFSTPSIIQMLIHGIIDDFLRLGKIGLEQKDCGIYIVDYSCSIFSHINTSMDGKLFYPKSQKNKTLCLNIYFIPPTHSNNVINTHCNRLNTTATLIFLFHALYFHFIATDDQRLLRIGTNLAHPRTARLSHSPEC